MRDECIGCSINHGRPAFLSNQYIFPYVYTSLYVYKGVIRFKTPLNVCENNASIENFYRSTILRMPNQSASVGYTLALIIWSVVSYSRSQ